MRRIVLIACSKTKASKKMEAKDLYQGKLFKKSLDYAHSLNPDRIFILSAKHHLLPIDKQIEPYDLTLNKMSAYEKKRWAEIVKNQIEKEGFDVDKDKFIFLAGENYSKYLEQVLSNSIKPLKGLKYGCQLQKLKQLINGKS